MSNDSPRFAARFWGPFFVCSLLAGALGCFAVAARAQTAAADRTDIITVTMREGVMTERLRTGVMTGRVRSETVAAAER